MGQEDGRKALPDDAMAPKGLFHYQSKRVVTREIVFEGHRWFVTWIADHDGFGWRVTSASTQDLGPAG